MSTTKALYVVPEPTAYAISSDLHDPCCRCTTIIPLPGTPGLGQFVTLLYTVPTLRNSTVFALLICHDFVYGVYAVYSIWNLNIPGLGLFTKSVKFRILWRFKPQSLFCVSLYHIGCCRGVAVARSAKFGHSYLCPVAALGGLRFFATPAIWSF